MNNNYDVNLVLELLEYNDLELPRYATSNAAGFDFRACLTRPCIKFNERAEKISINIHDDGSRTTDSKYNPDTQKKPKLHIQPNETILIPTGFKCEFNNNHVLFINIRSSLAAKGLMLANGTGIIDPDYRGEIFAPIYNSGNSEYIINHGDRIIQGMILPISQVNILIGKTNTTHRGTGGFGSTGQ